MSGASALCTDASREFSPSVLKKKLLIHLYCKLAEKMGLFAAYDGTDPFIDMLGGSSHGEGLWKSWARLESVKRLVKARP